MKIKIAKKTSKAHVAVVFIAKGVERLIERNGVQILEIPSGSLQKITPRTLRLLMRSVVQSAKKHTLKKISLTLTYADFAKCHTYTEEWFWSTVVENFVLAEYEYTQYKSKKRAYALEEIELVAERKTPVQNGIVHGELIARHANICRNLSNTPGSDMTPEILARTTKEIFAKTRASIKVLDEKAMRKLNMGGVLGVGKGSKHKPRCIIIEYMGGKKNEKPLVFVGKGVTFDTGGLQIKPGMAMYEMHMDMSGGASVIASLHAIVEMKIKKNVIGIIPAVENGVGEDAIRPGDVLTMMSGKTVDVLHTDAEGRIILADALHYARTYNPRLILDVATLTGASLVAVGQHAHVIMTKDRTLEDSLRELGEESGDYVFPLPLWDEYAQYTKGVHGDISNIPSGDSKYGGTIHGGMFLSHFTKKMRWVHIDMAPRMTSVSSDKLAKGATGEPVRLLIKIAEKL